MRSMGSNKSHCYWPDSPASFYKIIFSTLPTSKLRIPEKFAKKYGDELSTSSVVRLTVPNDQFWKVELEKVDETLWFHGGWTKFMQFYSIGFGYFLLFRYTKHLNFNVLVFDVTASEIQYPLISLCSHGVPRDCNECLLSSPSERICDDDSGLVEILDTNQFSNQRSFDKGRKTQPLQNLGKSSGQYWKGIKRRRATSSESLSGRAYLTRSKEHAVLDQGPSFNGTKNANDVQMPSVSNRLKLPLKHEKEAEMLDNGTYYRPSLAKNPFIAQKKARPIKAEADEQLHRPENPSYTAILRPYNVHGNYVMHLPANFARTYLHRVAEFVKLSISDGRMWLVRCIKKDGRVTSLSKGWCKFVKENNLVVGDVCVFEVVQTKNATLKVSIFRTT